MSVAGCVLHVHVCMHVTVYVVAVCCVCSVCAHMCQHVCGRGAQATRLRSEEVRTPAPRWLRGLGGEVSSLSWRTISPGEDALIPVTHSLEEFKAARWREGV